MNKNVLIRAVSLFLAAGVVLTAYGCGDKDEKEANVNQPVIENNTAVIEFTSVDDNGKEVEATNVVEVNGDAIGNLGSGSTLKDTLKDKEDENKFISKNEDYGIDKDTAQDIVNNAEKWVKFTYSLYIANTHSKRIAIRELKATNTENIIIDTDLGCEYGFNPGKGMSILVEGLVDSSKYETQEEIVAELNNMDIQFIYTLIDGNSTDVEDWSKVTTAYMPVTFSND